jgi:hypothetical protein
MSIHTDKQPEPVLTRAGIVTVIAVLSALLVSVGGGKVSGWLDQNSNTVAGLILAVAPLVSAVLARVHVTPSARPKAKDGTPLVPVGSLAASNAVVDVALARVKAIDADAAPMLADYPLPEPPTPPAAA